MVDDLDHRADANARARVLDVDTSFLVQAPAGSGKTGLLIQRVLALLAHVERPEQILAMTFTRKAAAEMRERVLHALRDAQQAVPIDAADAHALRTRALAVAALAQDTRCDWQLVDNPSRLRMMTIDALATAFARQAPITTGLGALPAFVDDAGGLYREAVLAALRGASAADPAWRPFLAHLDNDAGTVVTLLADMLGKRDQWRNRLPVGPAGPAIRTALEAALAYETDAVLARITALLPTALANALVGHLRYAAASFAAERGAHTAAALQALADGGGLPPASVIDLAHWQVLANWLLVKGDARLRSRWTRTEGFPAAEKKAETARARTEAKAAMEAWADAVAAVPGLVAALHTVRSLPPARYTDEAWAFVAATLALLPTLAAQLQLVFARSGETDFSEATLRALTALGDAEAPGDLLLAADLSIAHVLVDEFQDTSWTHLELIARLTADWSPGDGRTLFAVGDPMQSIYRFREAEVRIFLDAQASGRINHVPVECVQLTRNFRSRLPVVEWINTVFSRVLGATSNPARGEVGYAPVLATRGTTSDPWPTVELVADTNAETARVLAHIAVARREGAMDIAILVRSRAHLASILPALRAAQIPFTAVDLEALSERLVTRDLLTLTRALTQPADGIAGMALLRAPWCGLMLADLLRIADAARATTVLAAIEDPATLTTLSADGQARLARTRAALTSALAARGRMPLQDVVRAAWLALGGPACGEGDVDIEGANRYFTLLGAYARGGDMPDWDDFVRVAGKLYADAAPVAPGSVQVMTLHKAKGLEFDTVILPGLARTTRGGDSPPLRWRVREQGPRNKVVLLAPLHARTGAASVPEPVYEYLKTIDADEGSAELGRLMYVGCTRAKRRLHLLAVPKIKVDPKTAARSWREPPSQSALARLWPAVESMAEPTDPPETLAHDDAIAPLSPPLLRLPLAWAPVAAPIALHVPTMQGEIAADTLPFDWAQSTAAAIGTVAHRMLAQIARDGLAAWTPERVASCRGTIGVALAGEGVGVDERSDAADRVLAALSRTLTDPRGRWLFATTHDDARSEWALAGVHEGTIEHVTLDRTFVADGVRWIIDFKTGRHEGGATAAFLDREQARYRAQLERYARIVRGLDAHPVRLALYFPLVDDGWREWGCDAA
ncbi:MAG: UvrD-helicase domain-containing protein [Betaproteobacteria bacterium]